VQRGPLIVASGRNRSVFFKKKMNQFLVVLINGIEDRLLLVAIRQRVVAAVVEIQFE
jgi:hypothetical protein